ncbi:MAG: threonine synthase [Bacillota bacterium]
MRNVKHLQCIKCKQTYPAQPGIYTCRECGAAGILDVVYDYDYIAGRVNKKVLAESKENSMWRYIDFLPVEPGGVKPPLRVGWSPLYKAERLGEKFGVPDLWLKDDGINPTGSLKDRPSAIAVTKAMEEGADTVACSSTGNAASSLAGSAASAGLKSVIFVPGRAPQGKVAQLKIFGALVISVQGSYQEAFELSAHAIAKYGWYNRNAAINPYLVEGKKTVALEIAEQLGWQAPDWVVVSVGDGCTLAGVWKGFKDLYETGFINKLPRILSVQSEGCYPINRAFQNNSQWEPMEENTLADSIAVGVPRNPDKCLLGIRDSKGAAVNVADEEILEAMRNIGNFAGVFGEPAGVTAFAGLKKAVKEGIVDSKETVVSIVTGNGLKDTANGIKAAGEPIKVPPSLQELEKVLTSLGQI